MPTHVRPQHSKTTIVVRNATSPPLTQRSQTEFASADAKAIVKCFLPYQQLSPLPHLKAYFLQTLHQHHIQYNSRLQEAFVQELLKHHPEHIKTNLSILQASFQYIADLLQRKTDFCNTRGLYYRRTTRHLSFWSCHQLVNVKNCRTLSM